MKKSRIIMAIIFTILIATALVLNIKSTNKKYEITLPPPPQPIVSPVTIADFSSSAFIGDSRTQGLMMFGGITEATYYTGTGITVKDVVNKPLVKKDKKELTIIEALKENTFDNIIIMLGINELGWNHVDAFKEAYNVMLDEIAVASPDSKVYIQLVMPVNRNLIDNPKDYVNNNRIIEFNNAIKEICISRDIDYLDTFSMMANKDGNLYTSASSDGIHLNASFVRRWVKFMKGETIYEIFE